MFMLTVCFDSINSMFGRLQFSIVLLLSLLYMVCRNRKWK